MQIDRSLGTVNGRTFMEYLWKVQWFIILLDGQEGDMPERDYWQDWRDGILPSLSAKAALGRLQPKEVTCD